MLLGGVEFFVSSDVKSIRPGGDDWLFKIRGALAESCIVVVLVSPFSVKRTWVNFEAGSGWLKKRVVPLCHSGLVLSQLPPPLQSLQSLDLHNHDDLRELCAVVAKAAGLQTPEQDWVALRERLSCLSNGLGLPRRALWGLSKPGCSQAAKTRRRLRQ
jgi:hypothetical protein